MKRLFRPLKIVLGIYSSSSYSYPQQLRIDPYQPGLYQAAYHHEPSPHSSSSSYHSPQGVTGGGQSPAHNSQTLGSPLQFQPAATPHSYPLSPVQYGGYPSSHPSPQHLASTPPAAVAASVPPPIHHSPLTPSSQYRNNLQQQQRQRQQQQQEEQQQRLKQQQQLQSSNIPVSGMNFNQSLLFFHGSHCHRHI